MRKIVEMRPILAGGLALLTFSAHAGAQTPKASSDNLVEGRGADIQFSDIVVTARRKEESLQEVPIAATVFDSNSLQQRNITSTQDLFGQVPSLVVGGGGQNRSSENIVIRGMGTGFQASPGVVLYFAEVPIIADQRTSAQNGGGSNYYDLANVQVLRGPQGTLFGRNTTGGAVLFEPQRPTNKYEGYIQGQYGNYNSIELRGAVNVPIIDDTLLLRVAGIYSKRDGFTQELTTGTDLDDRNRYSFRVGLTWRPAPGVENYLMATMMRGDEHGSAAILNAVPAGVDPQSGIPYSTYLTDQIALGIRKARFSPLGWDERTRHWSVTDIFSADITDKVRFRTIANYSRLKHAAPFENDGIPDDPYQRRAAGLPGVGADEQDPSASVVFGVPYSYATDVRQLSFEPQIQGNLGDGALDWIVGAYYENVKPLGPQPYQPITDPSPPEPNQLFSSSRAVYAQATVNFATLLDALEGLRVTAGYRYTWDRFRAVSDFALPNTPATTTRAKFRAPNWTLGLDYDLARNILAYIKVSRGYKAGGIGRLTPTPELRAFAPEFVTTYEGGIKADWHLGSMPIRTNLNYYYTKYKDIQRTGGTAYLYTDPVTGVTSPVLGAQTINAGRAHIQGIEFEGEIRPADWLRLSANYSYTKAKYDEFTLPSLFPGGIPAFGLPPGFDCGGGVPFDAGSGKCILNDIPFQFAPKNQFSVTGVITLPVPAHLGNVSLAATYAYVDAQYTSPTRAPAGEPFAWIGGDCPRLPSGSIQCGPDDGYGLLNLNLQWRNVAQSKFDISAFATNLTNVKYIISSQGVSYQSGFGQLMYGEPRMYGVSIRYNFGR